jgi:hypothetical protein
LSMLMIWRGSVRRHQRQYKENPMYFFFGIFIFY